MKRNAVNTKEKNLALLSLIDNNNQLITVDANFFIPPDRSRESSMIRPFGFEKYRDSWIIPLINTFPYIAIHEAVYDEILGASRPLVDLYINSSTPRLILLKDLCLNDQERILRDTMERKIAVNTSYNPSINNKDDRGEVKSLAYISTKGLLYFCSHDAGALTLIEKADELDTGLQGVGAVKRYEILYYILKTTEYNPEDIRILYKYMYYTTRSDKECNPGWGEFVSQMNELYKINL